ncbi:hypothetical protein LCL95_13555 [Bacillus timonensis]|nr:hypothetical protein [Bacillus timonensis]
MDSKNSNNGRRHQFDQNMVKQALVRAYMKGENLNNISAKELIEEMVRSLKNNN